MATALLLGGDETTLRSIGNAVEAQGIATRWASDPEEARRKLALAPADVVVVDVNADATDCPVYQRLMDHLANSGVRRILLVDQARGDLPEWVTDGTQEVIARPTALDELPRRLRPGGWVAAANSDDAAVLAAAVGGPMLGQCPGMLDVYRKVARVAATNATVFISGESGTGKELVAQSIHQSSPLRQAPFVAINCGAMPENLVESELFGHERGAFTGANRQHRGLFEQADGGTLFLDEVTEMSPALQVKLLRVLETGHVVRVGGEKSLTVQVRVIAATNRTAARAVAEGRFRKDLLYRLSVFPIHLPPLRERGHDIELLGRHFLGRHNRTTKRDVDFTDEAMEKLLTYSWPGNVRELQNVVHRAFILADHTITPALLQLAPTGPATESASLKIHIGLSMQEVERRMIYSVLRHFDGNKKMAAQSLGISLKTLYNRLNEYRGSELEMAQA